MVLDSGDTAWMLVAGSLVLLMIPALGLFESGLLRKKNAASIFMQIFFGLALLSVMWFIFGFSISFGDSTDGLVGNLDWVFLKGVPSDAPLQDGSLEALIVAVTEVGAVKVILSVAVHPLPSVTVTV